MSTSVIVVVIIFFFSSRRRHTRWPRDWSSDVCSSDLPFVGQPLEGASDEAFFHARRPLGFAVAILIALARSEERRVGKEWSTGGEEAHEKKKKKRDGREGGEQVDTIGSTVHGAGKRSE